MSEAFADIECDEIAVAEDEGALKPSRRWRVLLFLIAFSPVIVLGIAVGTHAVNIPVWDDWERGEMWHRYYEGTLDFEYMYSPHIEHRSLLPRVLTLVCGLLFDGDLRAEIWCIFLIVAGTTLFCFGLLRHTLGRESRAVWPTAFLINLLICCPVQYPDFLWASMVAFMIPFFCLAAILYVSVTRLPAWAKLLLIVGACELGTHSFSEGLVLWPVAICLPLFSPVGFGSMRSRLVVAGLVAMVCAATVIPYFTWHFENSSHISHSYNTPTGEKSSNFQKIAEVLKKPKAPREYFFRALGNPLVRLVDEYPARSARNVGRVLFGGFVAMIAFLFWRRRDDDTWIKLLPWIAAACFAVTTAVLLALGRSTSLHRATMPRYIPMTIFLVVALVAVGAFFVVWWSRRAKDEPAAARRIAWGWGAVALVAVLMLSQWGYGLSKMSAWRDARYEARAALIYIKLFDPVRVERIDNTLEFVRLQAERMDDHGLLHPPLMDEWGFGPFERSRDRLDGGLSDVKITVGDEGIDVLGYALLTGGRVADGILVTRKGVGRAAPEVLGFVEMHSSLVPKNPFIDPHFGDAPDLSLPEEYAEFDGTVAIPEAGDAPLAADDLQCWALDARRMRAHLIP